MNAEGYVVTLGDDHDFRDLKKLLADEEVEVKRVYFAGYHLTEKLPKKKSEKKKGKQKQEQSKVQVVKKKKHKKRKNKNKGYHPHYLKGKK